MFLNNEYIVIIDNKTKNPIIYGQVKGFKTSYTKVENNKFTQYPLKCVSVDEKYFFNLKSKKFKIKKLNKCHQLTDIKNIEKNIPNNYVITLWKNAYLNNSSDVYREFSYNEIDEEIKKLVYTLNKIEGIETKTSCSGHYKEPFNICLQFFNMKSIILLTHLISNKFNNTLLLTTDPIITQYSNDSVMLVLKSIDIGENAYKEANRLNDYLETMIEG